MTPPLSLNDYSFHPLKIEEFAIYVIHVNRLDSIGFIAIYLDQEALLEAEWLNDIFPLNYPDRSLYITKLKQARKFLRPNHRYRFQDLIRNYDAQAVYDLYREPKHVHEVTLEASLVHLILGYFDRKKRPLVQSSPASLPRASSLPPVMTSQQLMALKKKKKNVEPSSKSSLKTSRKLELLPQDSKRKRSTASSPINLYEEAANVPIVDTNEEWMKIIPPPEKLEELRDTFHAVKPLVETFLPKDIMVEMTRIEKELLDPDIPNIDEVENQLLRIIEDINVASQTVYPEEDDDNPVKKLIQQAESIQDKVNVKPELDGLADHVAIEINRLRENENNVTPEEIAAVQDLVDKLAHAATTEKITPLSESSPPVHPPSPSSSTSKHKRLSSSSSSPGDNSPLSKLPKTEVGSEKQKKRESSKEDGFDNPVAIDFIGESSNSSLYDDFGLSSDSEDEDTTTIAPPRDEFNAPEERVVDDNGDKPPERKRSFPDAAKQSDSLKDELEEPIPPPTSPPSTEEDNPPPPPESPNSSEEDNPLPPPGSPHSSEEDNPLPPPGSPHSSEEDNPSPLPPPEPPSDSDIPPSPKSSDEDHFITADENVMSEDEEVKPEVVSPARKPSVSRPTPVVVESDGTGVDHFSDADNELDTDDETLIDGGKPPRGDLTVPLEPIHQEILVRDLPPQVEQETTEKKNKRDVKPPNPEEDDDLREEKYISNPVVKTKKDTKDIEGGTGVKRKHSNPVQEPFIDGGKPPRGILTVPVEPFHQEILVRDLPPKDEQETEKKEKRDFKPPKPEEVEEDDDLMEKYINNTEVKTKKNKKDIEGGTGIKRKLSNPVQEPFINGGTPLRKNLTVQVEPFHQEILVKDLPPKDEQETEKKNKRDFKPPKREEEDDDLREQYESNPVVPSRKHKKHIEGKQGIKRKQPFPDQIVGGQPVPIQHTLSDLDEPNDDVYLPISEAMKMLEEDIVSKRPLSQEEEDDEEEPVLKKKPHGVDYIIPPPAESEAEENRLIQHAQGLIQYYGKRWLPTTRKQYQQELDDLPKQEDIDPKLKELISVIRDDIVDAMEREIEQLPETERELVEVYDIVDYDWMVHVDDYFSIRDAILAELNGEKKKKEDDTPKIPPPRLEEEEKPIDPVVVETTPVDIIIQPPQPPFVERPPIPKKNFARLQTNLAKLKTLKKQVDDVLKEAYKPGNKPGTERNRVIIDAMETWSKLADEAIKSEGEDDAAKQKQLIMVNEAFVLFEKNIAAEIRTKLHLGQGGAEELLNQLYVEIKSKASRRNSQLPKAATSQQKKTGKP
jgi:hypothetical protein